MKLLFQLSAFPIEYLKTSKNAEKRFPFLKNSDKEMVGLSLKNIDKLLIESRSKKEEKLR